MSHEVVLVEWSVVCGHVLWAHDVCVRLDASAFAGSACSGGLASACVLVLASACALLLTEEVVVRDAVLVECLLCAEALDACDSLVVLDDAAETASAVVVETDLADVHCLCLEEV